jgi:hypothetical protein
MAQPRFDTARVDRQKIIDYLLGSTSFAAVSKARFFSQLGVTVERWEIFADALRAQADGAEVRTERSDWGTKYVATGPIDAINGRRYKITSVWIDDGSGPRLVTAYPAKD